MPIFEYRCAACGAIFETLVLRRSDEDELACEQCGAPRPEKLISAPARSGQGGSDGGGCAAPSGSRFS